MFPCQACSGEAIRITANQKQRPAGCAFCTAVSLERLGFTKTPERHCGCYARNPEAHEKNHKDTQMIGRQFSPILEIPREMKEIPKID